MIRFFTEGSRAMDEHGKDQVDAVAVEIGWRRYGLRLSFQFRSFHDGSPYYHAAARVWGTNLGRVFKPPIVITHQWRQSSLYLLDPEVDAITLASLTYDPIGYVERRRRMFRDNQPA